MVSALREIPDTDPMTGGRGTLIETLENFSLKLRKTSHSGSRASSISIYTWACEPVLCCATIWALTGCWFQSVWTWEFPPTFLQNWGGRHCNWLCLAKARAWQHVNSMMKFYSDCLLAISVRLMVLIWLRVADSIWTPIKNKKMQQVQPGWHLENFFKIKTTLKMACGVGANTLGRPLN